MRSDAGPGRTVLVTGGSRGIGAAVCMACAACGFTVAVNYARDDAAAGSLVDRLRAAGASAVALRADVADEAQVLSMFARIDAELPVLGALVNSAGVVDVAARLDEMSFARWQRMFAINVFGSFVCAREAVKRLSTRHGGAGGAIVNLSSAAARLGSPSIYVDYAASKGAIDSFTLGLARELAGEGVRVNAVRPGIIDTDIHASAGHEARVRQQSSQVPMGRTGRAEEVAEAVAWLLSDAASYTTGALLDVAGGR